MGECLADATPPCPGGTVCDDTRTPALCVIAPRPCDDDLGCASVERCDPDKQVCVARRQCLETTECGAGETCDPSFGLCFTSP
jgi:hypothetical protein